MQEIAISEFKAKCLAIVDKVQKTKQPIRITRRGKPVAELVPATPDQGKDLFGFMRGSIEVLGDIMSPANDPEDWEVLRD